MLTNAASLTSTIDVAQVVLYAFWLFFAGLIYYLRREDKREGYPLESEGRFGKRVVEQGWPVMPSPKTFRLANGETMTVPRPSSGREVHAKPTSRAPGSPHVPTGDPLKDGVGPAGYALRADHPELTYEGEIKIVPLREHADFSIATEDTDPRGLAVVAGDGATVGKVVDAWVDKSEYLLRYLEVELAGGGRRLLPTGFWTFGEKHASVVVHALHGKHFAGVPGTAKPGSVTQLEEEKIMAYFGGGLLYAEPSRQEPLL